jgi:hypothetical protein
MSDPYLFGNDIIPGLPDDYQPVVQYVLDLIVDFGSDATQPFLKAVGDLGKSKGNWAKLDGGVQLLSVDVAGAITEARNAIERGNASFASAWVGRGAESFAAYVQLLINAIKSVETSATTTAAAVALFRQALHQLWSDILKATIKLGTDILTQINSAAPGESDQGKKKKAAKGGVVALITVFVSWGADILSALLAIDREKFLAYDKLREAAKVPDGVKDIGPSNIPTGAAARHWDGPSGYQLPMPNGTAADPAWNQQQVKDHWKPKSVASPTFSAVEGGRGVAVDTEMMQELINVFRGNGIYWTKAVNAQAKAQVAHFTSDAFGFAGKDFRAQLQPVLIRDYLLYIGSDGRMDALGGLLDKINEAYGHDDKVSSQVMSQYLTNGPVL